VRDTFYKEIPQYSFAKTSVLYNSLLFSDKVSFKNNNRKSEGVVWGYAGRISPEKNVLGIVKVFKDFFKLHKNDRLIIAGDITTDNDILVNYKKEVMDVIEYTSNIEYLGFQNNLSEFYADIDFFVMASFIEGISVAALDSLASGVPVISSDVGSMSDIIKTDKNGILFPLSQCIENPFECNQKLVFCDNDQRNFLKAIEKCRSKKWNREQIAKNTKNKYSQKTIEKEFIKKINELINKK
jgi:glycosyltransferase involved in cell wall biosynthesis